MTDGDDILYLITLRNLEIHLVIGGVFWDRAFNWLAMVPITLTLVGDESWMNQFQLVNNT